MAKTANNTVYATANLRLEIDSTTSRI